jgi:UDP-glucose 4-epimerase
VRIVVTGGCGYIGSVVASELLAAGHQVVIFDSLITGHRSAAPEAAVFVQAGLDDVGALNAAFDLHAIDAVMHFASFIQAGESMQKPAMYFRNNVSNSLNLIEAAVTHGVKRFVLSSTAAVYSEPAGDVIREDNPLGPAHTYGETKLMTERMLRWFGEIHGLRYAALRYFNAAGAVGPRGENHDPETHLIPLVLQVPLGRRDKVSVFGTDYPTADGTCVRDYIHIYDLASAHLLALDALGDRPNLTYNLGNGKGYSVREVIEVARRVTGHPIPAVEVPRRPGDAPVLVASSERIVKDLGWKPKYPQLEAIIRSAWEWHRAYPTGYPD